MNKILAVMAFLFLVHSTAFATLETVKGAKKDVENFKQTMSMKLQEIDKKIDTLEKQGEQKKNEMIKKSAEDYERMQTQLRNDVDKLEADAEGDWKKTKKNLAISIDDLNNKVQKSLME